MTKNNLKNKCILQAVNVRKTRGYGGPGTKYKELTEGKEKSEVMSTFGYHHCTSEQLFSLGRCNAGCDLDGG